MEVAKIRKEAGYYLVYFFEERKVVPVNLIGAKIINCFFNKGYSINKLMDFLNRGKEKPLLKKDIKNFLFELKQRLSSSGPEGHPVFGKKLLNAPISAEIQINTQCNLRCKHCFQDEYHKIMPFERARKFLEILAKAKVFEIHLVGGEIFLHPYLFEILALCEKHNFTINIVTNGTLIDDSILKKLAKVRNLAVLVSLEGVDEVNDEIRGEGVFKIVDQLIKKLKKNNIYVEISTTITAQNFDKYKDIVAYAKKLDVPCNFNLFKPFKESHSFLTLDPEKYFGLAEKIFKDWDSVKSRASLTSASLVAKLVYGRQRDECRATTMGLTIDVDGKMVPCSTLQAAGYYGKKQLPDFDENFTQIWKNNYHFQAFRKRGLAECQARSYLFNKDIDSKDPYGVKAFEEFKRKQHSNQED